MSDQEQKKTNIGIALGCLAAAVCISLIVLAMIDARKWPFEQVKYNFSTVLFNVPKDDSYDAPDIYELYGRNAPKNLQ
ncbi:hypothetical protein BBBOND_0211150 [Babesia bigemina]|uniref:Uncharacterized protein n=1 Tax=Babesia bigemina TaxID=5866 RepID=A0A061D5X9_BABBI|nr:hypothetical protein BBBOND_0211150 [Babesia bigemina]CDR95968.1 hypothetical protein BBBOND_0211150 [Babesia bigemina]|eukprot:XP_012768154.1 hypothetical protein BBBOND_0211150 [Babesia bigemina]